MDAATLIDADRQRLWHPYASTTRPGTALALREARGATLVLDDGRRVHEVVDAMASWWCQIHGYRHPDLDAAAHAQMDRFSHVMFGGLTHEPAVMLARRLGELTREQLTRVFLADSGSVAMEVALKLARQWAAAAHPGSQRHRIAALRGGYHGDTLGAMSVCDPDSGMHAAWAGVLPRQVFLPRPPRLGCSPESLAA